MIKFQLFVLLYTVYVAQGKRKSENIFVVRSEEHTSELQSRQYLVCRLLLEKKKNKLQTVNHTDKSILQQQSYAA